MKNATWRRGLILGWSFVHRSRTATKFLAAVVGAVLALALSGLFGLIGFIGHVGEQFQAQALGEGIGSGCVEGHLRYDIYALGQYENILLAARCGVPPIPPGLERFPTPGDVFLSPALAHLRHTDGDIALRFPQVDGLIMSAGLTSSNELRSITGVKPSPGPPPIGRTFDTFGTDIDYLSSYLRFDRLTFIVTGLFFTLMPSMYLIAACTRLNARTRERQLGLLSVIGLNHQTVRRALTIEAGLTTGAGALIGLAFARPTLSRLTPTFVAWKAFPGDVTPSWVDLVVVFVIVFIAAIVAASLAAKTPSSHKRHRKASESPRSHRFVSSAWRWTVFVAGGLAAMVTIWWTSDSASLLVLGGRIATFIGLIVVVPLACSYVGLRLVGESDPVTALVGARLRRPSGTLTRALAALGAGLFVFSAGATTVETLGPDPGAMKQEYARDGNNVLEVYGLSDTTRTVLADYDVLGGNRESAAGRVNGTLIGSCDTLRATVGAPINCERSTIYASAYDGWPDPGITGAPLTPIYGPRSMAVHGSVITVLQADSHIVSAFSRSFDYVLVPLPVIEAEALYSRLIGNDPMVNVRITGAGAVGGASELNGILDIFRWGAIFAISVALLAAIVSLTGLLYDRQSANNYLQILGLTRSQIATAALIEVGAAGLIVITLTFFSSWLWALSYSINSNTGSGGIFALAWPFVLSLIALLVVSAAVVVSTMRTSNVNVIPDRDGLASVHDVFTHPSQR